MALSFQKPARYRQRRDFHSNLSYRFLITAADPSHSLRMTINVPLTMTLNVLYKDHGVGRWKELLAHAVRLRILACRNDLNRKRIVSLQLTAHS